MERRTKWHYEVNNGFVPILQLPNGKLLTESAIIMEFLASLDGSEPYAAPYKDRLTSKQLICLKDPETRALHHMIIKKIENFCSPNLYGVIMTHGEDAQRLKMMHSALNEVEQVLTLFRNKGSEGPFFFGHNSYCLLDLMLYPHLSRLFYLKNSCLHKIYKELQLETKYPRLTKFYEAIRACEEFGV